MRAPLRSTLIATALLAPVLSGCLGAENAEGPNADVVATFYPLGFLAERIGGDNVTVATLVPAGVEPHEWEPTAREVARVAGAKVLIQQGAGFEPWVDGLLTGLGSSGPRVVDTTADIPLVTGSHDHAHVEDEEAHDEEGRGAHAEEDAHANEAADGEGELDPHTWLDPVLYARQARAVERALADAYPQHAPAFQERADALVADLNALNEDYKASLTRCDERVIITSHDAFTYMSERYEFDVLAVSGLAPESEPDPQTVAELVEEARAHNLTVVFFEELVSPRVSEVVAKEVGAETRVLSPIEGLTPEAKAAGADYFSLMRQNLGNLQEAMRCRGTSSA